MTTVDTKSGLRPSPRSSRTVFCVGLVFCSPVDFGYNQTLTTPQYTHVDITDTRKIDIT